MPAPAPKADTAPQTESTPEPSPAGPRHTLAQILLSESNIKIALYLGAFFVVASAAILGAFVDVFRIPLLILGTLFFGGVSVAIRKRLPQPSFALFIVFSFLLPIDANVLEETIGIIEPVLSVYWTIVFLLIALVWSVSIWFYESRLFSIVAFISLGLAFQRAGEIFQT